MIGLDEGSSSARISRYETGIHEPTVSLAEKMADILHIPLAYFYCPDDELAGFIRDIGTLDRKGRMRLRAWLDEVVGGGTSDCVPIDPAKWS